MSSETRKRIACVLFIMGVFGIILLTTWGIATGTCCMFVAVVLDWSELKPEPKRPRKRKTAPPKGIEDDDAWTKWSKSH